MTLLTWLSFFANSGSTSVKAVRRTLMKLSPSVNFINILCATFLSIFWCQKISKPNVIREKLLNLLLYKNARVKCWWNWLLVANIDLKSNNSEKWWYHWKYLIAPYSQFHQHFTRRFFKKIHCQKIQTKVVSREKLFITLHYQKSAHKILMKITPTECVMDLY